MGTGIGSGRQLACSPGQEVAVYLVAILVLYRVLVHGIECCTKTVNGLTDLRLRGEVPLNSEVINKIADWLSPYVVVDFTNHLQVQVQVSE